MSITTQHLVWLIDALGEVSGESQQAGYKVTYESRTVGSGCISDLRVSTFVDAEVGSHQAELCDNCREIGASGGRDDAVAHKMGSLRLTSTSAYQS